MAIRLDVSEYSVVVHCTDCPGWIVLSSSRVEGHARANEHERSVHPEQRTAESAAGMYARRHAVKSEANPEMLEPDATLETWEYETHFD